MKSLAEAQNTEFARVRFVLTDMDETLTYKGRLAAATYQALERLQAGGVTVIPVTAAPAGWCDQMSRMWPVDGVIGENGGLFIERDGHDAARVFWNDDTGAVLERLRSHAAEIMQELPGASLADDQPFRLTSIAFRRSDDAALCADIFDRMKARGLSATLNNLWILGWEGGYDKLSMSLRVLEQRFGCSGDALKEAVFYSGDSENDAPMFAYFKHTLGVSTVRAHLPNIPVWPNWISNGPGGAGFVEAADAILTAKSPGRG